MRRLGILGGTFDPVHIGHLLLAQFIQERIPLDAVLFVPAAAPPHKEEQPPQAPAIDRWAMVQLAVQGFPDFQASDIELDRPGKSYTFDTLRELRAGRPDTDLYLIIGADNVSQLSTWHEPEGILDLCTVVAGSRITDDLQADPALVARMLLLDTPVFQVSSTEIRQRLEQDLPIRCMVPENVEAYIADRGLYRN